MVSLQSDGCYGLLDMGHGGSEWGCGGSSATRGEASVLHRFVGGRFARTDAVTSTAL